MGSFAAGQVVLLPFPFSDLSHSKFRPAHAIALTDKDFVSGSLQRLSYVRPGKLFTANVSLFATTAGVIMSDKLNETRNAVIALIQGHQG